MAGKSTRSRRKVKAEAPGDEAVEAQPQSQELSAEVHDEAVKSVQEESSSSAQKQNDDVDVQAGVDSNSTLSVAQARLDRFKALQRRQREATLSNRAGMTSESTQIKNAAREAKQQEKQRMLEEMLQDKKEVAEGIDVERRKAWTYNIEQSDNWEKKQRAKKEAADQGFLGYDEQARRIYNRETKALKPDMKVYLEQKEHALGLPSGSLQSKPSSSSLPIEPTHDLNSLSYATHKPSEGDLDRLTSKINRDIDRKLKFSRKRVENEDADVTYINKKNKHFNEKLTRFYSKFTAEIQENLERGTAL